MCWDRNRLEQREDLIFKVSKNAEVKLWGGVGLPMAPIGAGWYCLTFPWCQSQVSHHCIPWCEHYLPSNLLDRGEIPLKYTSLLCFHLGWETRVDTLPLSLLTDFSAQVICALINKKLTGITPRHWHINICTVTLWSALGMFNALAS